jgi:hypothetical protein
MAHQKIGRAEAVLRCRRGVSGIRVQDFITTWCTNFRRPVKSIGVFGIFDVVLDDSM